MRLHRGFKVDNLSPQDLLVYHRHKDIILPGIREDNKEPILLEHIQGLEVFRRAVNQQWCSNPKLMGRACHQTFLRLARDQTPTHLVQNLLNAELLKPSAAGSLDFRSSPD